MMSERHLGILARFLLDAPNTVFHSFIGVALVATVQSIATVTNAILYESVSTVMLHAPRAQLPQTTNDEIVNQHSLLIMHLLTQLPFCLC